jgi:RNA polymerase sigma-70 factor (ECF subfamily)
MESNSEEKRFLEAYDICADSIFRLCVFKTGDRETALDLTQETFTRVWNYIVSGNKIQNIPAFAFTTARNLIKDYYKKKKPVYEHEMAGDMPDVPDEAQASEEQTEARRLLTLVYQLKDNYREVILLRYGEGMDVKEIAELLDERDNTISVRISRALDKLKTLYEGGV